MDSEPAGIDIESYGIVDKHERYEEKQCNEDSQHCRDLAEISVQRIHKRTLIHHLIHKRRTGHLVLHHFQTVRRDIVSFQRHIYRDRDRRSLEHIKKVIAEHVRHLALALLL